MGDLGSEMGGIWGCRGEKRARNGCGGPQDGGGILDPKKTLKMGLGASNGTQKPIGKGWGGSEGGLGVGNGGFGVRNGWDLGLGWREMSQKWVWGTPRWWWDFGPQKDPKNGDGVLKWNPKRL